MIVFIDRLFSNWRVDLSSQSWLKAKSKNVFMNMIVDIYKVFVRYFRKQQLKDTYCLRYFAFCKYSLDTCYCWRHWTLFWLCDRPNFGQFVQAKMEVQMCFWKTHLGQKISLVSSSLHHTILWFIFFAKFRNLGDSPMLLKILFCARFIAHFTRSFARRFIILRALFSSLKKCFCWLKNIFIKAFWSILFHGLFLLLFTKSNLT